MADYYDSIDCVAELASKEWVRANVESGWRPVGRGRLPRRPVVTREIVEIDLKNEDDDEAKENSRGLSKGGAEQLAWCDKWRLPPRFRQVLNKNKSIVHLYVFGSMKTACGVMKCKEPDNPAVNAKFSAVWNQWDAEETAFEFCRKCYGAEGSVFAKFKERRNPI